MLPMTLPLRPTLLLVYQGAPVRAKTLVLMHEYGLRVIYYQHAHPDGQWMVKHLPYTVVTLDETEALYKYFVNTNW